MPSTDTTVFVASTDTTVCEVLARVVEAAGPQAIRGQVGSSATQVVGQVVDADADVLVLDLGADNHEVLSDLRGRGGPVATEVRVVVIGTGPATGRLAWLSGADGFLVRPFADTELIGAIDAALTASEADRASVRASAAEALRV